MALPNNSEREISRPGERSGHSIDPELGGAQFTPENHKYFQVAAAGSPTDWKFDFTKPAAVGQPAEKAPSNVPAFNFDVSQHPTPGQAGDTRSPAVAPVNGDSPHKADKPIPTFDFGPSIFPKPGNAAKNPLLHPDTGPEGAESDKNGFSGTMSWYGARQAMANGRQFDRNAYTVAHKTLPLGSIVNVTYQGRTLQAEVTDRGPYVPGRTMDISYGMAKEFGVLDRGLAHYNAHIVSIGDNAYHAPASEQHHRHKH